MITVTTKEDVYNIYAENREKYLRNFFLTYSHSALLRMNKKIEFKSCHSCDTHVYHFITESKKKYHKSSLFIHKYMLASVKKKNETFINVT